MIKLANDPLCEKCMEQEIIKVAVLVHHVDKDESNNEDENLMSVCNDCHEMLHKGTRFGRNK